MKLRNKKTGEIKDIDIRLLGTKPDRFVGSIAELNADWEDYEEPKEYWYIYADKPQRADCGDILEEDFKAIGNYFETKEEAEKAVERLKAWKRLKELGFRFIDWELDMKTVADGKIWFDVGVNTEWDAERLLELKPEAKESLDTIFGGKNE